MSNNQEWQLQFLIIYYKQKRPLVLREVQISYHKSREAALGYAWAHYDCGYVKTNGDSSIIWYGNPGYNNPRMKFGIISKVDPDNYNRLCSIDISYQHTKFKLKQLFEEMISDWTKGSGEKLYKDMSIEVSQYAWQTSIPDGWKLLKVGAIIKETDMEYDKLFHKASIWGSVSWYNIGKKVKKGMGISWTNNSKVYKRVKGDNDPLIIRKCISSQP